MKVPLSALKQLFANLKVEDNSDDEALDVYFSSIVSGCKYCSVRLREEGQEIEVDDISDVVQTMANMFGAMVETYLRRLVNPQKQTKPICLLQNSSI